MKTRLLRVPTNEYIELQKMARELEISVAAAYRLKQKSKGNVWRDY